MDQLVTALEARILRFYESRDPSAVLDPVATDEASQLWEAARSENADPMAFPVDVLTVLAHLHLARYQVLPEGRDQKDLEVALRFFSILADRAPERVPDKIRGILAELEPPPGDAYRLATESSRCFAEYQRVGRPELLDSAVVALRGAVAAALPDDTNLPRYLL